MYDRGSHVFLFHRITLHNFQALGVLDRELGWVTHEHSDLMTCFERLSREDRSRRAGRAKHRDLHGRWRAEYSTGGAVAGCRLQGRVYRDV